MIVSLIAALDRHRVIGLRQDLPWSLPADRRFFRRMTLDKPVVMGRRTYETLKGPLARRTNIVLTHSRRWEAKGCVVVHSVADALEAAGDAPELMVAGGAEIYAIFLGRADRMYLTFVDAELEGDTWFPSWDADDWVETAREDHAADDAHAHAFSFVTLERRR